ncbi:Methyl-directed repair DNA adenine methylase [Richelia intracellularis HH01]|uniref:Site-specific DNA-methyltransferase (adenine-specific) n=1 Tax=Richelia intracellularis HH01 TaxID=1165094 RepID=M1WSD1_9NOST|nr:DNA adenine methylase [Richelia intracellularis]CCH67384.1 Methyl-directed repair DNA adenine methylase [Richelia intracellularis HH01]
MMIKPFLKWAGGKNKLLSQISHFFPPELENGGIKTYIEPFVGGGAIFLHLASSYQTIERLFISDINPELYIAYKTIQNHVDELIAMLSSIENQYLSLSEIGRKDYFYQLRRQFNQCRNNVDLHYQNHKWIERTAQLIFLNQTCFNGLFRVNSKGEFNVPMGKYSQPRICNAENLCSVSLILENTFIYQGDFSMCEKFVDNHTFIYLDPPYKPISKTSNFTSYSQHKFDDLEQLRLRDFFKLIDSKNSKLLLSNSEFNNYSFFSNAYSNYRIERIRANRTINSNISKRNTVNEILIMNY